MLRRWIERKRRAGTRRAAQDLQDWLEELEALARICSEALSAPQAPPDIGVILDRVDRGLMHFRGTYDALRRPLRAHSPRLAADVAATTEQLYRLRNDTCAFLLRAQDVRLRGAAGASTVEVRRAMDEARLRATAATSALSSLVASLKPELSGLIGRWAGA